MLRLTPQQLSRSYDTRTEVSNPSIFDFKQPIFRPKMNGFLLENENDIVFASLGYANN